MRRTSKRERRKTLSLSGKAFIPRSGKKGPARDKNHLDKVRREQCLVCEREYGLAPGAGNPVSHAHHTRLGKRTMGVRVSDYLTVPLCPLHHDILHLKFGNEAMFWVAYAVDPREWIRAFSSNGQQALKERSV